MEDPALCSGEPELHPELTQVPPLTMLVNDAAQQDFAHEHDVPKAFQLLDFTNYAAWESSSFQHFFRSSHLQRNSLGFFKLRLKDKNGPFSVALQTAIFRSCLMSSADKFHP